MVPTGELREFDERRLTRRREVGIDEIPIAEADRRWHGPRPDDERGPASEIPLR